MIADIPYQFQPKQRFSYPSYCTDIMVEQYVAKNYKCEHERIYLPIFWTNYYVNNAYGHGDIEPLYEFLDSLDKSNKYFTVVQYDDGILQKPNDLDLLVFSSGSMQGVPIPLLTSHYLQEYTENSNEYDISFIGNTTNHAIRKQAIEEIRPWVLSNLLPKDYSDRMSKSKFSLCPRGYGATSFRLYEALASRSIPIYISDEHILPYAEKIHWNKIAIIIHSSDIAVTRQIMAEHKQDWEYFDSIKHMFTMQGTLNYIESCLV
jgi:hypothetical protein